MTLDELKSCGVEVEPLEWREMDAFGKWKFWDCRNTHYEIGRQLEPLEFIVWFEGERIGSHPTLEAARAACDAHHAARVAASLRVMG